ncbi:MAG: hypothetical protein V1663_01840 [archaeon]
MNCLTLDSLILTEKGLKLITEIKKGEMVYAFDQKNYDLVLKKCDGVFDNGKKRVYSLSTLHHDIKATGNHPFLVLKHNGRSNTNEFIWKRLENIKMGDDLVVQKDLKEGKKYVFEPINISKKGDYKVNKINKVKIPKKSNEDLMKLLGLWVGDGWTRTEKAEVAFAIPEKDKARKVLINLIKKVFKIKPVESKNEVYIRSINVVKFIDSLGLGKGSKNKTIPSWIFTLTKKEKEEFLEGLMLSDGYKMGESWRYPSSSYDLVKRLRLLLQTMNYRVGKLHNIKIKKGKVVVYRKLLKDTQYWYMCFSKLGIWNTKKYKNQYKYKNFLIENKYFSIEKVRNIKQLGVEPTLDLRVEGEHNFIANGIIVHNTGVQRSSATSFGADTTTETVGKFHQGKEKFRKDITKIVVAHNIPYVAQASLNNLIDLYNKAEKAFNANGPAFINVLQPCTLGWRFDTNLAVKIAELAVKTNFWPLYEVENNKYTINYKNENRLPIIEFLKLQGRFKHLLKDENKKILDKVQEHVDKEWDALLKLEKNSQ